MRFGSVWANEKCGRSMKRKFLNSLAAAFLLTGLAVTSALYAAPDKSSYDIKAAEAIKAVINAQAAAWNRGDLEGYMDGYDRSPNTEFVGGDTITRGWQTVLDRYRKNYSSREKMGALTFSDLQITILSKDAALVLGRWHLKRA